MKEKGRVDEECRKKEGIERGRSGKMEWVGIGMEGGARSAKGQKNTVRGGKTREGIIIIRGDREWEVQRVSEN